MSAHPYLSPGEIAEALRNTASHPDNPKNRFGYGIIDAYKAASYFGPVFSNTPNIEFSDTEIQITTSIISSKGIKKNSEFLYYQNVSGGEVKIKLDYDGKSNKYIAKLELNTISNNLKFYFKATDEKDISSEFPTVIFGKYFNIDITLKKLSPLKRRNLKRNY